jgi:hypothetical protein
VEPFADADVKLPGVIAMLFAPVVTQLSVLPKPALMLCGLAVKEATFGAEGGMGSVVVGPGLLVEPPQPVRPVAHSKTKAPAQNAGPEEVRAKPTVSPTEKVVEAKRSLSVGNSDHGNSPSTQAAALDDEVAQCVAD